MPLYPPPQPTWRVLANAYVNATTTAASTSELALATIALPAGLIGANGHVKVTASWSVTTSGNIKTLRLRLGGLSGTALYAIVPTTNITTQVLCHIWALNSQSAQSTGFTSTATSPYGASAAGIVTGAINLANAQDLVLSGQCANAADTVTLNQYLVEYFYRA